jgi:hypothetical protein
MTHTPEVIETRELNDEQVGYRIRCCGDATTESWNTISVMVPSQQEPRTHDEILTAVKADVAARHEAKLQWRAKQPSATPPASSM